MVHLRLIERKWIDAFIQEESSKKRKDIAFIRIGVLRAKSPRKIERSGIATRGSAPSSYLRTISSSLILISSKTTGLPSPSRHHRAFRRRSVAVTPSIALALALAPSIACCRNAVRRCCAATATTPPPRRRHATATPPPSCRRHRTVALPSPPSHVALSCCCHHRAATKLPPTSRCRPAATTAATALLPPRFHRCTVHRRRASSIRDSQLCCLRFNGIAEEDTTMCLLDDGDHRSP